MLEITFWRGHYCIINARTIGVIDIAVINSNNARLCWAILHKCIIGSIPGGVMTPEHNAARDDVDSAIHNIFTLCRRQAAGGLPMPIGRLTIT